MFLILVLSCSKSSAILLKTESRFSIGSKWFIVLFYLFGRVRRGESGYSLQSFLLISANAAINKKGFSLLSLTQKKCLCLVKSSTFRMCLTALPLFSIRSETVYSYLKVKEFAGHFKNITLIQLNFLLKQ